MMHNMMFGMEAYSLFWIAITILLCILIVGTYIWLLISWLNNARTSTMPYTPQSHNAYEGYGKDIDHNSRHLKPISKADIAIHIHSSNMSNHKGQYSQTLSSEH